MTKEEFAQKVAEIEVLKRDDANGAPSLTCVKPAEFANISASNSPDSVYKEKSKRYVAPFNIIISQAARRVGYADDLSEFFASTPNDVNRHVVESKRIEGSTNIVYIRTKRLYNNHVTGNKRKSGSTMRKENTHMKNRKVTLTLFTVASGFGLTLQITGSAKDATAWTRFCDPDLSKAEYDNATWTKDVESQNKAAVEAVDAMIQIQEDYDAGNLNEEIAKNQFVTKYVEWVLAHLETNPEFVERRIIGLNCENPMSAYQETDEE